MNRPIPWHQTVSAATPDTAYFEAAPERVVLRIRPMHEGDPAPMAGTWCPSGMQLATLTTREGARALFWIDARITFGSVWTDDQIRELLFEDPRQWEALRSRPGFSASYPAKPCPAA